MADNNNPNRDNHASVAEDDPFAELARIMGQGSRDEAPAEDQAADEVQAEQAAPEPAETPQPEDADPFAVDLEQELLGDLNEVDSAYSAGSPEEDYAARGDEPDYAADDASREAASAEPAYEEPAYPEQTYDEPSADEPAYGEPAAEEPAYHAQQDPAYEPEGDHTANADVASEDAMLADVDMDFGDLDAPASAEDESYAGGEIADTWGNPEPAPAEATDDAAAGEATDATDPMTLEDELELLLASGGGAQQSQEAANAPSHEGPQSTIFTRANFAGDRGDHATNARHEEAYGQSDYADEDAGYTDRTDDTVSYADEQHEEQAAEADPFAALATFGAATHAADTGANETAATSAPVDVDTVDVPETAQVFEDDLDLPEVPVEEPAPALSDDFDSDFSYAFPDPRQDMEADAARAAPEAAAPVEPAFAADDDDRFFAEALGAGAGRAGYDYDDADALAEDPFSAEIDREFDAALAGSDGLAEEPAEEPARRNNGFMIAAAVIGVALIGGIGAFALSFGGGDTTDTPVLVEADSDPTKVRPENPGGASDVPNQDSVAYEAAAGAGDDQPPQQESLVTTTEEPVNIASRTVETTTLPGVDDAAGGDGMSGKSEDRLAAPESEAAPQLADEVVAVQPRRVRTMIVRPDGTLVPREDPAPAETAEAAPAAAQPETVAEAPADAGADTTETTAATTETDQTEVAAAPADPVTPNVVSVVPTRPATQTAPQQPQQVAQAPAATRTEPAAPAPTATASSEWSMQIASQPTAEGAQQTYQDLARRYGSLLGGRGVNIVRAEIPGKGTYYRVRIPTSSRNDGISLCERYKAAGGSCFVSR